MPRGGRVALALIALGAVAAAWLLLGRPTEDTVPGGQGGARPTQREAPDALSLVGGSAAADTARTPQAAAPRGESAAQGCEIECTFEWPQGETPIAGEVAVMREGRAGVLAAARVEARGIAHLTLPAGSLPPHGLSVELVGIVEGCRVEAAGVLLMPGGHHACTLVVTTYPDAPWFTGQVVSPTGHPVRGLALRITADERDADLPHQRLDAGGIADQAQRQADARWETVRAYGVPVVTDEAGHFRVKGRTDRPLHAHALSPLVRLRPPSDAPWRPGEVRRFVAHQAFQITIALVADPAPDWSNVALAWTIRVDGAPAATTTMNGAAEFIVARWTPPEKGEIEIEVIVETIAHSRFAERWKLPRERSEHRLDVELRALGSGELGSVRAEGPRSTGGESLPALHLKRTVPLGTQVDMWLGLPPKGQRSENRFTCPPGRARLIAWPATTMGHLLQATGEFDVAAAQETAWRPTWPPHGALEIEARTSPSGIPIRNISLEERGNEDPARAAQTLQGAQLSIPYMRAGRWRITGIGFDPIDIEIHAGRTSAVVIGR
jgi:hypothetical protein